MTPKNKKALNALLHHGKGRVYERLYVGKLKGSFPKYIEVKDEIVSLENAIEVLSSSREEIIRLKELGILNVTNIDGKEMVQGQDVANYLNEKSKVIFLDEFLKRIGLNNHQLQKFIDDKLIKGFEVPGLYGRNQWIFELGEVHRFLSQVTLDFKRSISSDKWVPFAEAVLILRPHGVDHVKLTKMIVNGEIKAAMLKSKSNFEGMYVVESQIVKLAVKLQKSRMDQRGYTASEVARALNVKTTDVKKWIDEGEVTATKVGDSIHYIGKKQFKKLSRKLKKVSNM